MEPELGKKIIGIDLGTTYSRVAVWRHGGVEIIPNEHGNRRTPSVVAFTTQERHLGETALHQIANNLSNTIFSIKRLMGKQFEHPDVQRDIRRSPFRVVSGDEGQPSVQVDYKGDSKSLCPEEITAMILIKMKSLAEIHLGIPVDSAVITVPACFTERQRKATKDAATIAGFTFAEILSEASAAAISYGYDPYEYSSSKNVLVFDLGGGKLDVSLLHLQEGTVEVKSAYGDTALGGEDIDMNLVKHFVDIFRRVSNIEMSSKAMRRLRLECEKAKRNLSTASHTVIDIDSFHEGVDFEISLSREDLYELNWELFERCVDIALKCAGNVESIDEIILVGGSTRIPKLREMLMRAFQGKYFCKSLNADEAVASGAAIWAASINNELGSRPVKLFEITPFTLLQSFQGNAMNIIIEQNSFLPVERGFEILITAGKFKNRHAVPLFQGDGERFFFLGEFCLTEFPPYRCGGNAISLEFRVCERGLLTVSAWDVESGFNCRGVIEGSGRLMKEEIERMRVGMKRFEEDDREVAEKHEAKNALQKCVQEMRGSVKHSVDCGCSETDAATAFQILDLVEDWIVENEDAEAAEMREKMTMVSAEIERLLVSQVSNGNEIDDEPCNIS